MKYRIVERVYEDYTNYLIQKRVFGFWVSEVFADSSVSFREMSFPYLTQAQHWLRERQPDKHVPVSQRVVE